MAPSASGGTARRCSSPTRDPKTLRLWDVAAERVVGEYTIPIAGGPGPTPGDASHPVFYARAMAADGSRVAASIKDPEGRPWVFVWDAGSSRPIHRLPGHAPSLAFSSDGSLLAGGEDAGKVHVWSLPEGRELSSPWQGSLTITGLTFGRNLRRGSRIAGDRPGSGMGWWLAAGDWGGNVSVWDAATGMLHVRCNGRGPAIEALAFSPDGTLVAAGGDGPIHLWEVATGTLLLDVDDPGPRLSLAFSPDGRVLASGSVATVSSESAKDLSRVSLWELEDGRGIRTLRGLATPIARIWFSADGRHVAALASDWRLAIWDRSSGMLRHILEPPEGITADNAALAFSHDGRRFAFASGTDAAAWDLGSGRRLDAWTLPPGLSDLLSFGPSGQLDLFRVETTSGERARRATPRTSSSRGSAASASCSDRAGCGRPPRSPRSIAMSSGGPLPRTWPMSCWTA